MGLFKRRKKKQKNGNEGDYQEIKKAYYEPDWEKCRQFVEEQCKLMKEASYQLEDAKKEYEVVTESLTDIQMLDETEPESFSKIAEIAEKIVELNAEKQEVKKEAQKISQNDYFHMMTIEAEFFRLHERMEEDEKYCQAVRSDMYYLESEKGSLKFELEEKEERLYTLRRAASVLGTLFIIAVIALGVALIGFALDITVAGSVTFLVAAVAGVLVFCLYRSTLSQAKLAEKKLNRAITLLNSTKIRYVNITNSLDYQYMKHNVHSAYDFNNLYELYQEVRKEKQKFQKASGELHNAEEDLIRLLAQAGLKDPHIWIYQAHALVDKREMVEVRHTLNTSRQKLRTQMDYSSKVVSDIKEQIMEFTRINKQYTDEIMDVVNVCTR
ncbi:MAG: hypothetical protein E7261_00930 [Lachnospiraceae bacterium]|nr:hypothetical protein [Lachnospiraceae bacterium]